MTLLDKAKEFLYANDFAKVREFLGSGARSVKVSAPMGRFDVVNMFGTEGVVRFEGGSIKHVGEEFCIAREGRTKNLVVFALENLHPSLRKVGAKVPAFETSPSMGVRRAVESFIGRSLDEDEVSQEEGFAYRTRTIHLRVTHEHMADYLNKALEHAAGKLPMAVNLEVFRTGIDPMLSQMSESPVSGARALFELNCTQIGFAFSNVVAQGEEPTYDFDCFMTLDRGDFKAEVQLCRGMDAWTLDVQFFGARSGEKHRIEALYCEEPLAKLLEIAGPAPVVVGGSNVLLNKLAA